MTLMHFLQWLMQAATEQQKLMADLISKLAKLSCQSGLVSKSASLSPLGLSSMFVCPICLSRQKSPKSHSEHLHNACKGENAGRSTCAFNMAVPEHAAMFILWGDLPAFVSWYCSHLSSHDVQNVTSADIANYHSLKSGLEQSIQNSTITTVIMK
jgi:hypothetical protein